MVRVLMTLRSGSYALKYQKKGLATTGSNTGDMFLDLFMCFHFCSCIFCMIKDYDVSVILLHRHKTKTYCSFHYCLVVSPLDSLSSLQAGNVWNKYIKAVRRVSSKCKSLPVRRRSGELLSSLAAFIVSSQIADEIWNFNNKQNDIFICAVKSLVSLSHLG